MKTIRITIALLLALCMTGTAVCCLADAERVCNMNGEIIVNYEDGTGGYTDPVPLQTTVLNDDVTSTGGQDSVIGSDGAASAINTQVLTDAPAPAKSEVTVNGDVSCEANWVAGGLKSEADAGSTEATANGDVSAVSYADSQSYFDELSQTGGVQTSSNAYGVAAQASGENTHATATVTGNVSAEAKERAGYDTDQIIADGVMISACDGGTAEVTVGGNVDVKSDMYANGVDISGGDIFGRPVSGEGSVQADVGGNITVEGTARAVGLNMQGFSDETSETQVDWTVNIGGDIMATTTAATVEVLDYGPQSGPGSDPDAAETRTETTEAVGVIIYIDDGTADAVVTGDITAKGAGNAIGADLFAQGEDTKVTLKVTGEIAATADAEATGIQGVASDGGTLTLDITGDVTVAGKEGSAGVVFFNDGGEIGMTQTGNVVSDSAGLVLIDAPSLDYDSTLAGTKVTVIESEYSELTHYEDRDGTVRKVYHHENEDGSWYDYLDDGTVLGGESYTEHDPGTTSVTITGDVTAKEVGAVIDLSNDKSQIDLIVDGTLSGETQSVLVSENTIADNLTLTVWEIKANKDGNLVERAVGSDDDGNAVTAADRDIEKNIQYIIKVEPTQQNIITTQGTTGYNGYNIAREGETVTLKVEVPEGYQIKNAFSDTVQTVTLAQDANGNYYLIVPKGGAVMISVEFEKIPDTTTATAAQAAAQQNNAATQQDTEAAQAAVMKAADETAETTAFKNLIENSSIMSILPEEIKTKLPARISKVAEAITMVLEGYDPEMGTVTLKIAPKKTYTKGEKATVVIALPDGNGGYTFFYIEGIGQEDGTLNLNIPADTAKAIAGKTFVTMILE